MASIDSVLIALSVLLLFSYLIYAETLLFSLLPIRNYGRVRVSNVEEITRL